jgi:hypothetical protein
MEAMRYTCTRIIKMMNWIKEDCVIRLQGFINDCIEWSSTGHMIDYIRRSEFYQELYQELDPDLILYNTVSKWIEEDKDRLPKKKKWGSECVHKVTKEQQAEFML